MGNLILGKVRTEIVHLFEKLKESELKVALKAGTSIQAIKKDNAYNEMLHVSFDTVPFKVKVLKQPPDPITGNVSLDFALTNTKLPGLVAAHDLYFSADLVNKIKLQVTTVNLYETEMMEYVEPECIPCSVPEDDDDVPGKGQPD